MSISALNMSGRQNVDVGRYVWLNCLVPDYQGSLHAPELNTTNIAMTQDDQVTSTEDNSRPSSARLEGSTVVESEGNNLTNSEGNRNKEVSPTSGTKKRGGRTVDSTLPPELGEQHLAETTASNWEDERHETLSVGSDDI